MIRVNLLATERPTQKSSKKAPSAPGAVQVYLFLFVFVGGALAACAVGYFYITNKIATVKKEIAEKQDRLAKLQAVKKQVDEFENKKKTLQAKVDLIEKLRAEQSGPVHLLDELSKALPDQAWLVSLAQTGNKLTLKGNTTGLNAVADYIAALQRSGWFSPVELRTMTENNNLVTFELNATFTDPNIAAKAAAAEAAAAKAAAEAAAAAPAAKK
jgi:type IV pilus assembly protein PilN